ncbi:uncharacterized protein LOC124202222 [Daphnia pulex]|uniref:uncharacterized protein LOC124202222 n=1 Tax=Daphnia pulex TaxID=6669 RepID=UPI001EDE586E|nr:uncharacterized protein LOC124202222 [Daphnia pulex]
MVRFSTIFIHAALAALVALACPADAAALKVEEQLQLLQTKVNQLEAQVQQHEMLAEKFDRLERVLEEMQNERKTSSSWASVSPVHAAIPRTCREAQFGDPTLSS